jgi:hypothetical protein
VAGLATEHEQLATRNQFCAEDFGVGDSDPLNVLDKR